MVYTPQIDEQTTQNACNMLQNVAPEGPVSSYDRRNLSVYAQLLDAEDSGLDWRSCAEEILGRDPLGDAAATLACWQSHVKRARWIVGGGLAGAVEYFNKRHTPDSSV